MFEKCCAPEIVHNIYIYIFCCFLKQIISIDFNVSKQNTASGWYLNVKIIFPKLEILRTLCEIDYRSVFNDYILHRLIFVLFAWECPLGTIG